MNESMISLLLKLHSKLTGIPDSYVPFWETPEALKIIEDAKYGLDSRLSVTLISQEVAPVAGSSTQEPQPQPAGQSIVKFSYRELYNILNNPNDPASRIGDGPFFVGKVLDEIGAKDEACRETIINCRERLWPRQSSEEEVKAREEREREERRRKARERQLKLMAEFAKKQKQFMEKAMNDESFEKSSADGTGTEEDEMNRGTIKPIEYDCVICNQTSPSTSDNPVGLVSLLQSTSVLGHRRRKSGSNNGGSSSYKLPTSDDERLDPTDRMTYYNEKRIEEFKAHFDESSWIMSISGGWEGGVHVQTCGHHLHMECLKGYMTALKSQQRQNSINTEKGEYSCPLCRQLANTFLPLSPEFGIRQSALVKDRKTQVPLTPEVTVPEIPPSPEATVALEVMKLLREYPVPTPSTKVTDAITKIMEDMTNATKLKYRNVCNEFSN